MPLLLAASLCAAQTPIRVDVNLINVAFSVRDAQGRLVHGLTEDSFEVLEDAVPRKIAFFARALDVPLTLGLAVDFSGSQEHFIKQHHRDLEAFLKDVLGPRDQAFLVCFGNHLRLVSDVSPSGKALVDSLQRFEKGERRFPELGPMENRLLGTAFYDAIYYSVAEKLVTLEGGRRALLVFSDGEDNSSARHMLDAIEAAQRADTLVFAVRYTEVKGGRLNARNKYGMRVLERLARETGGAHFDAQQGDLRAHFREIGEELRAGYELAYHSTHPAAGGTFRKIVIRAKRPDLTVRAKTGYFAR